MRVLLQASFSCPSSYCSLLVLHKPCEGNNTCVRTQGHEVKTSSDKTKLKKRKEAIAEYLEKQLKRMSPGMRRTRRKQIERKREEKERTHREIRKKTTADMHQFTT